jgi:ribosome modulation factor
MFWTKRAYIEGYAARVRGQNVNCCPYRRVFNISLWCEGWRAADKDPVLVHEELTRGLERNKVPEDRR